MIFGAGAVGTGALGTDFVPAGVGPDSDLGAVAARCRPTDPSIGFDDGFDAALGCDPGLTSGLGVTWAVVFTPAPVFGPVATSGVAVATDG